MEELYEKIKNANKEIKLTTLKQKKKRKDGTFEYIDVDYCDVKERVIAFRKVYPNGVIDTDVVWQENYVVCKATVSDGSVTKISDGYARELLSKEFALENCQTSAIGRALGFAGFGISTSIATAEDMENVNDDNTGNVFDGADRFKLIQKIKEINDVKRQAEILNFYKVKSFEELGTDILNIIVNE